MKSILYILVFIGPLTLACIFVNCHSSHSHVRYLGGGEDTIWKALYKIPEPDTSYHDTAKVHKWPCQLLCSDGSSPPAHLGETDNNPISFKVNKPDTIPMIHSREDSLKYCVVYTDLTQHQQESITGDSIRLRCFTKDKVICNWPKVLPPKFQDKANKIKASVDSTIKNPRQ